LCRNPLLRSTLCIEIKCKTNDGFVRATEYFNENEHFSEREGTYSDYVFQPTNYSDSDGINVYRYGLRPEDHLPSGTVIQQPSDTVIIPLDPFHNSRLLWMMSGSGALAYTN
jgi:hypothetical protein